jgi:hypothetical protein
MSEDTTRRLLLAAWDDDRVAMIVWGRYIDPVNRERDLYLAELIDVDELDQRVGSILGVGR